MKSLLAGLVGLVIATLAPSVASASTTNFGTLNISQPYFLVNAVQGPFTDYYNFSLAPVAADPLEGIVSSLSVNFPVLNLSLSLFSGTSPAGTLLTPDAGSTASHLFFTGPLSGNFFLAVSGTTPSGPGGFQTGAYSGILSVAAAVPLPASLPLMITGLLGLGLLVAARRRNGTA